MARSLRIPRWVRDRIAAVRRRLTPWRSHSDLLWQWLLYVIVGHLSRLWSRDDQLWVFGARGGDGFVDNAKYLYLWVAANDSDVRPVWLTKDDETIRALQDEGYEAYHAHSWRGRLLTLRAGVVCVTQGLRDVQMGATAGATLVQLWHGLPLKTIGWDAEWPDQPWPVQQCHSDMADEIDLVTAPAAAAIEPLSSGLGIDPERFAVTGYPRTDVFDTEIDGARATVDEAAIEAVEAHAADSPVVFYLPTYRQSGTSFVDALDVEAVGEKLAAEDAHLYIKAHPYEPVSAAASHPHVHWLPASVDPYLVLPLAEVVVTDYSSVLFDYLAVDRPLVFFAYDRAGYTTARGFYFDYESVTPGAVVTETETLCAALDDAIEAARGGSDPYTADRRQVRERFCPIEPGDAAATVHSEIRRCVFDTAEPETSRPVDDATETTQLSRPDLQTT